LICAAETVLRVSYESLHADFRKAFCEIVSFYDLRCSISELDEVAKKCSFFSMKEVEQRGEFPHPWLRPLNGHPKVRWGMIGGYKDALCARDIEFLNLVFTVGSQESLSKQPLRWHGLHGRSPS
jgi:hypothetical protein